MNSDDLDRLANSKSTAERLRAMTQQIGLQLMEARQKHVVTINTLATEAVDIMQEYIKALEAHVIELEQAIKSLELELAGTRAANPRVMSFSD